MSTSAAATGAWTIQSTDTALIGRLHDLGLLVKGAANDPVTARSGVLATVTSGSTTTFLDLQVLATTNTGTLQCTVNPGAGVINRSGQAAYEFTNQTLKTVTLTASNPTNPRIDRISARIYDLAQGDTVPGTLPANGGVQLEVTDGTPAGSPVAPSLPPNSIALATVLVPANAVNSSSLTVTDARQSVGVYGSTRPLLAGDTFAGPGGSTPTGFGYGELLDTPGNGGGIYRWSGSVWWPLVFHSSWATYTPTWTGLGVGNVLTSTGRWAMYGKTVMVNATMTVTSGANLGTGGIGFTVPYTSGAPGNNMQWTGNGLVGGGVGYLVACTIGQGTTTASVFANTNTAQSPGSAGDGWANGNFMTCNIMYEAA